MTNSENRMKPRIVRRGCINSIIDGMDPARHSQNSRVSRSKNQNSWTDYDYGKPAEYNNLYYGLRRMEIFLISSLLVAR